MNDPAANVTSMGDSDDPTPSTLAVIIAIAIMVAVFGVTVAVLTR